jgi:hypothetical protein
MTYARRADEPPRPARAPQAFVAMTIQGEKRLQWVLWATAVLLVIGVLPFWSGGFDLFLRIAVCAVSLAAILLLRRAPRSRLVTLAVILVAFNPFYPPRLPQIGWAVVDFVAAYFFWSLGATLSARASAEAEEQAASGTDGEGPRT